MSKTTPLKVTVTSSIFITFFAIASLSYVVFRFYHTGFVIFNDVLFASSLVILSLLNGAILTLSMLTLSPKSATLASFRRLRWLSNLILIVVVVSLALITYQITTLTPNDPWKNLGFILFIIVVSLIGPIELFFEVEVLKIQLTDRGFFSKK